MKLYHTGALVIQDPDVYHGRKNADFGQGFYLTPDREFTYRWAGENAVVNAYELDTSGLTIHRFSRDAAWFDYIFHNRRARDTLSADVVIGPIANDTIFDTMGILSSGFLTPEEALQLLSLGPEYTQVTVKTERAVKQLRWIGAETIARMEGEQRRQEQEEYLNALGAAMQEIAGES